MTGVGEKRGLLSAPELMEHYAALGAKKTAYPAWKLLLLGISAGLIIGLGAVAAATASHGMENPGLARLVSGAIFPCGLGIVMLTGSELFTGNTMIALSVLDGRARLGGMLKNWLFVYLGNLVGSVLLAAAIAHSGQLGLGGGALAVYAIGTAINKATLTFGPAVLLGILCNVLVCLGVLCSLTAKDTAGRILGAYIPVFLFIIGGFEHCVANMYYIPVGMFAAGIPEYAAMAAEAGLNLSALTVGGLVSNLIPVTVGNIIGGTGIGCLLWLCHRTIKGA